MKATDYEKKTIFCTGLTGFIGTNLYLNLAPKGAQFVALVPKEEAETGDYLKGAIVHEGKIEDIEKIERILEKHRVDYVIHLAASATVGAAANNPLDTFETNVRGTWNVMEAIRRNPGQIKGVIFASTDKVYGNGMGTAYVETEALEPEYTYDISKACADTIARGFWRNYNVPIIVTRFCNVYGAWDRNDSRIVPRTLKQIREGKQPVVHYFRDMDGRKQLFQRDLIYIEDIIDGLERTIGALEMGMYLGEVFNLGTGQCYTVDRIVEMISLKAGYEGGCTMKEITGGELHFQSMSFQKAKRLLGFEPTHSLEMGIEKTVAWFQGQGEQQKT
ncbi:MAG: NAD-dependent epimerase/dehydratase family protein [Methylomicrobium sp.]|nr:NAD-dependent epimerase/dehydratase family protein [Methylomicrobium sp.]